MAEITLVQINEAIDAKFEKLELLTKKDVTKIVNDKLESIELPAYEEQIKTITETVNETRNSLNTANEEIKKLTATLNKVIEETDVKIKKLSEPKKSILDEMILPE